MGKTLEWYNDNAARYAAETVDTDMRMVCDRFLALVRPGGRVLDLGCGSGRDLKYFREQGFEAEGLDGSAELCKLAADHSGCIRCHDPVAGFAGCLLSAEFPERYFFIVLYGTKLCISGKNKIRKTVRDGSVIQCLPVKSGVVLAAAVPERYVGQSVFFRYGKKTDTAAAGFLIVGAYSLLRFFLK